MSEPLPNDASEVDDPFERLVNICLERFEVEGESAVTTICSENPEHADRIRKHVKWLVDAGLIESKEFPDRLGEFRLVRRLGGGGMGAVFLAEQEGLGRQVALKLVRPEQIYFEGSRERFRREVEAVARLKHPGIVPIYTFGEEKGVPYYAMERVEGCTFAELLTAIRGTPGERLTGKHVVRAIDEILDDPARARDQEPDTPTVPEMLRGSWVDICFRLITQVAAALHHAHGRGVIHRDIKPSNMMVTRDGRALLLDFGLASSEGTTKMTVSGARVGSLPYMSPEQVDGGQLDIRTDVYSLGVTLYEMLTFREPFIGENSESTVQLIREGHPKPIRLFNRKVPWDAETVCLAAMEAEPKRRYSTAADFDADLERFLRRKPVEARRPGPFLKATRWVQRRPAVAVSILLAILLSVGLPTALLIQEKAAAQAIQRKAETAQRVSLLMIDLFQSGDRSRTGGAEVSARAILDRAASRIRTELDEEPEVKASLMRILGTVYRNLGLFEESETLLEDAVRLSKETKEQDAELIFFCQESLAGLYANIDRYDEAESCFRSAIELRRTTSSSDGDKFLARAMSGLGLLLARAGRNDEAHRWLEEAVAMNRRAVDGDHGTLTASLSRLGTVLLARDHPAKAIPVLREAREMTLRLEGENHANSLFAQAQLARALFKAGNTKEAEREYLAAKVTAKSLLDPDNLDLATLDSGYASLLVTTGRLAEARTLLEGALRIREKRLPRDHTDLAQARNDLAIAYERLGKRARAREMYAKAIDVYKLAYGKSHTDTAICLTNLAAVSPNGLEHAREALAMLRELKLKDRGPLAHTLRVLASNLAFAGQPEEALRRVDEALAILRKRFPGNHRNRARTLNTRSLVLLMKNDGVGAAANAQEALSMWRALFSEDHGDTATAQFHLGWALRLQGKTKESEQQLTESRDKFLRLFPDGNRNLAHVLMELGPVQAINQKLVESQRTLERAVELGERHFRAGSHFAIRPMLDLSRVCELNGDLPRAETLGWAAIALQRRYPAQMTRWSHQSIARMLQWVQARERGDAGIPSLLRLLESTVELFPRYYGYARQISKALVARAIDARRYDDALPAIEAALRKTGDPNRSGVALLEQLSLLSKAMGDDAKTATITKRLRAAKQAVASGQKR